MAIEAGIPEFMKKSIILQTFGVNYKHPCQEAEHVVIPPYIPPESVQRATNKAPANRRRDIWAFFRGKMEVNPKNISGRYYSKCVRSETFFFVFSLTLTFCIGLFLISKIATFRRAGEWERRFWRNTAEEDGFILTGTGLLDTERRSCGPCFVYVL